MHTQKVELTIYSVSTGTFSVINGSATKTANVTLPYTTLTVNATVGGGGMSDYESTIYLLTTPSTAGGGFNVPISSTQIFTPDPGQIISDNASRSIDSGSWGNYEGNGTIKFNAGVVTTGTVKNSNNNTFNSALSTANTTLTITYTYDAGPVPVPEASTVIVQLLIVAGGVWMFVRRRRAAAVRA